MYQYTQIVGCTIEVALIYSIKNRMIKQKFDKVKRSRMYYEIENVPLIFFSTFGTRSAQPLQQFILTLRKQRCT